MPDLEYTPYEVAFFCEACEKRHKPRKIRSSSGTCSECFGTSWMVVAAYSDTQSADDRSNLLGGVMAVTMGVGWKEEKTTDWQETVGGVSAEEIVLICEKDSTVISKVQELFQARHELEIQEQRDAKVEQGAVACKSCGILLVPREDQVWTLKECCSLGCFYSIYPNANVIAPSNDNPEEQADQPNMIAIRCASGHDFEVPKIFSGVLRPCPECGAKTLVP